MKGRTGLGAAMKKVGRNMARANQQAKGYAKGGMVMPSIESMGSMGGEGMEQSGFGRGKARGGKSKGRKFGGVF